MKNGAEGDLHFAFKEELAIITIDFHGFAWFNCRDSDVAIVKRGGRKETHLARGIGDLIIVTRFWVAVFAIPSCLGIGDIDVSEASHVIRREVNQRVRIIIRRNISPKDVADPEPIGGKTRFIDYRMSFAIPIAIGGSRIGSFNTREDQVTGETYIAGKLIVLIEGYFSVRSLEI